MIRLEDTRRFYGLLDRLERCVGGRRTLAGLRSFNDWPHRGVYFFFEPGEIRRESGEGLRVVRVGTHALSAKSRSTLSQRLSQHRGGSNGKGNHRGSIFRLLVGRALVAHGDIAACRSWGVKGDLSKAADLLGLDRNALAAEEEPIEQAVSRHLAAMPFVWLGIDDDAGPAGRRDMIERNCIALLSNFEREPIDPASPDWIGHSCGRPLVRGSGLWNQRHVDEGHDPSFLNNFEDAIAQMEGARDGIPQ
jgi:hypothetical protein